jgi:hypothetical protein
MYPLQVSPVQKRSLDESALQACHEEKDGGPALAELATEASPDLRVSTYMARIEALSWRS